MTRRLGPCKRRRWPHHSTEFEPNRTPGERSELLKQVPRMPQTRRLFSPLSGHATSRLHVSPAEAADVAYPYFTCQNELDMELR